MYQYTFDEETTKKIKNQTSNSNDILNKFNEVDKKYSKIETNSNSTLELNEMPYKTYSDQEIKTKAENNLYDYKNSNIDSINKSYNNKMESIDNSIENVSKDEKNTEEKIKDNYSLVKENAENDAIKRGLARSSIIVNKLAELDNNMLSALEKQRQQGMEKIDSLNQQKTLLEEQKQNALNAFDITYAVKLQNEIENLNDKILSQNQEAVKYNNQIAQIMANWEKSQDDEFLSDTKSRLNFENEYGANIYDVLKQKEKYQIASEYFANMSKDEALSELTNNSVYKQNLGSANYKKLKDEIDAR